MRVEQNMREDRRPAITVRTECDGKIIAEDTVETLDIMEDFGGRDVLTFRCPKCRGIHASWRYT